MTLVTFFFSIRTSNQRRIFFLANLLVFKEELDELHNFRLQRLLGSKNDVALFTEMPDVISVALFFRLLDVIISETNVS